MTMFENFYCRYVSEPINKFKNALWYLFTKSMLENAEIKRSLKRPAENIDEGLQKKIPKLEYQIFTLENLRKDFKFCKDCTTEQIFQPSL